MPRMVSCIIWFQLPIESFFDMQSKAALRERILVRKQTSSIAITHIEAMLVGKKSNEVVYCRKHILG